MSRRGHLPGVLLAGFLALIPAPGHAGRGVTSPESTVTLAPVPTATTPSLPPAGELLARMQQVVRAAGSVRIYTTFANVSKQERVIGTTHTDMSWLGNSLRERDVWNRVYLNHRPQLTTVERRTLLVAHHVAASRGTSGHSWYCESLPGVQVGTSFTPFQIGTPPATSLGPAVVGGVAVWHIQAKRAIIQTWVLRRATVDFYFGQADGKLRELQIRGSQRPGGVTSRVSVLDRYSRFGETVRVTLPAACRPQRLAGVPRKS